MQRWTMVENALYPVALKSLLSEVLQCECVAWAVYLGSLFTLEIICSVAAMQIFSFVVSYYFVLS